MSTSAEIRGGRSDWEWLQQGLADVWRNRCDVVLFDDIDSTNRYLSESASNISELCFAHQQSAGVGRRGTRWITPPDNIALSLARTFEMPASSLMGLSLVAGIAIVEALSKVVKAPYQLKWPNDILVSDRKLAGILVEVHPKPGGIVRVVVGVGVNVGETEALSAVGHPVASLTSSLLHQTTGQSKMTLKQRMLLSGSIGGQLLQALDQFESAGWAGFATRWSELDYLLNKKVQITDKKNAAEVLDFGVARGVDHQGCLLVEHNGVLRTIVSGDVSARLGD